MNSKSIVITVVIILAVVLAAWYFYSNFAQQSYNIQPGTDYTSDTTGGISSDLEQIPDDSSINSEMDSLNQDVQGF